MTKIKKNEPEDKALERLKQFEQARQPIPDKDENENIAEQEQDVTKTESEPKQEENKNNKSLKNE